jgi:hypothetical protein
MGNKGAFVKFRVRRSAIITLIIPLTAPPTPSYFRFPDKKTLKSVGGSPQGNNMAPEFTTFSAVPHPQVRPMAYANSFLNFM